MGSKSEIGVVLNYTYLHAITRIYTRFMGGNVTGVWPRMKHGQNTDSEKTFNRRERRKRRSEERSRGGFDSGRVCGRILGSVVGKRRASKETREKSK